MLNFIMIKNRSKLEWNGEYGYQVYIKIIQEAYFMIEVKNLVKDYGKQIGRAHV